MGIQSREPARDPQDLERLLVVRQNQGDVEGMVALFEPEALIDVAEGDKTEVRLIRGHGEIRAFFAELCASGRKFRMGQQAPAVVNGDLALTGTRMADGKMTAEVARRQSDGTWLWTIDKYLHW
ncbi:YybH family protein [Dongia sp.]|uniref:YybH family protein n=1 Tax=Dongia sp. TaxID=1977262 RepID=UPI003753C9FD